MTRVYLISYYYYYLFYYFIRQVFLFFFFFFGILVFRVENGQNISCIIYIYYTCNNMLLIYYFVHTDRRLSNRFYYFIKTEVILCHQIFGKKYTYWGEYCIHYTVFFFYLTVRYFEWTWKNTCRRVDYQRLYRHINHYAIRYTK